MRSAVKDLGGGNMLPRTACRGITIPPPRSFVALRPFRCAREASPTQDDTHVLARRSTPLEIHPLKTRKLQKAEFRVEKESASRERVLHPIRGSSETLRYTGGTIRAAIHLRVTARITTHDNSVGLHRGLARLQTQQFQRLPTHSVSVHSCCVRAVTPHG
jgi:hypothetical protein